MPSFLKDLNIRRRSRISLRTGGEDNNTSSENSSSLGEEQRQRNKSTSTLSSWLDRRPSPPTPLSPANGAAWRTRLSALSSLPFARRRDAVRPLALGQGDEAAEHDPSAADWTSAGEDPGTVEAFPNMAASGLR